MLAITGASGFLGSALVWRLNCLGRTDLLLVDVAKDWKLGPQAQNLTRLHFTQYMPAADFLRAAERDRLPKLSGIVHLGGCSSTTAADLKQLLEQNFDTSRVLARWALKHQARFLYASSAATYGDGSQGFSDDPNLLGHLRPQSRYAQSKHLFDLWAQQHGVLNRLTGLKFFNVFGPQEYHKGPQASWLWQAFQQVRATGSVKLFKSTNPDYRDGEQKRDFLYVKDCVETIAWLLEHPSVTGLYNVGTGTARSFHDVARALFAALNLPAQIDYIDPPAAVHGQYQFFTEAKMERLLAAGCPAPAWTLEAAVTDYVKNYLLADELYFTLPPQTEGPAWMRPEHRSSRVSAAPETTASEVIPG